MHDRLVSLKQTQLAFDKNIEKIRKLVDNNYFDESIILIVSIFEVFLRDSFRACYDVWFLHAPLEAIQWLRNEERVEYRNNIRKYLESIGAFEEYLKNYYVYQDGIPDPEMISLYKTLFETRSKRGLINFQNLTERNGARSAYLKVLDIDLMKLLDSDQNISNTNWEKLNQLFLERHEIIHNAHSTSLTKSNIHEILDSLEYLENALLENILRYYGSNLQELKSIRA